MSTLVPIQLDNGMVLYIEAQEIEAQEIKAQEIANAPLVSPDGTSNTGEQGRGGQKGGLLKPAPINAAQSMQMVQNTIRTYATYCLDAFQNLGNASLSEVTLEFGVNLSADAGIPYIASGKAASNLKITVKCTYPKEEKAQDNGTAHEQPRSQPMGTLPRSQ